MDMYDLLLGVLVLVCVAIVIGIIALGINSVMNPDIVETSGEIVARVEAVRPDGKINHVLELRRESEERVFLSVSHSIFLSARSGDLCVFRGRDEGNSFDVMQCDE